MLKCSRQGLAALLVTALLILAQSQSVVQAEFPRDFNQYVVRVGEDLWSIGAQVGVDPQELAAANNMDLYEALQVGQKLVLPKAGEKTHRVKAGENLSTIAASHGITLFSLLQANESISPDKLKVGQSLKLPVSRIVASRSYQDPEASLSSGFDWPVIGPITSVFGTRKGEFHEGIDIAAESGVEVQAARGGTIIYSGWITGYGLTVKIDHGDGVSTLYAHNSRLLVKQGESVSTGQAIAEVGSTGRSTGPHVHFEVRYNGIAKNPMTFLKNTSTVAGID